MTPPGSPRCWPASACPEKAQGGHVPARIVSSLKGLQLQSQPGAAARRKIATPFPSPLTSGPTAPAAVVGWSAVQLRP
jgi:hypothetical protein